MAKTDSQANLKMDRPTLILLTVYFHDSEKQEALRLGQDLYGLLTRPVSDPLAFGAGVPVFSARQR